MRRPACQIFMKDSVRMQIFLFAMQMKEPVTAADLHTVSWHDKVIVFCSVFFFLPVTVCCCSCDFRCQPTAIFAIISLWIYSEAIDGWGSLLHNITGTTQHTARRRSEFNCAPIAMRGSFRSSVVGRWWRYCRSEWPLLTVSGLENICEMGMQSVFLPESGGGVEYLTLTGKRKKFWWGLESEISNLSI